MSSNQPQLQVPLAPLNDVSEHVSNDQLEEQTTVGEAEPSSALANLPNGRKLILLAVFSAAQFFDVMNISSMFIALPSITSDIDLTLGSSVWIITTYSLTFASFLLLAGLLADLYSPKKLFLTGFLGLGLLSIALSFATQKYAFLVLRAVSGIFGALTIPSAINIIVHLFPYPSEQQKYLALFQLASGIGNVMGLVLAGVLELASWHWIFRFIAILVIPLSFLAWYLLPAEQHLHSRSKDDPPRWRQLDIIGTLIIMVTLILFILSLTEGNIKGWKSAGFLVPFLISVVGFPAFFNRGSEHLAVLPSSLWKIKNFSVWVIVAFIPYTWWACCQTQMTTYSQSALNLSPILSAARILPQGIASLVFGNLATVKPQILSRPRWTVLIGLVLTAVGTVLISQSNGGAGKDYWRWLFPGYIIGSFGNTMTFLSGTVGLMMSTPPKQAGVAGAWFNVVLQVGSVIGLSIEAGLFGSFSGGNIKVWKGSQDSFWMLLAAVVLVAILFLTLYRSPKIGDEEDGSKLNEINTDP